MCAEISNSIKEDEQAELSLTSEKSTTESLNTTTDKLLSQILLEMRTPKSTFEKIIAGLNVFFTGLMVLVTVFLVFWASKQWDIMNKQWQAMNTAIEVTKEMNKETKKYAEEQTEASKLSAISARSSSDAANRAVQISEKSLKSVERAYIAIKEVKIRKLEAGQKASLEIVIENAGKMPALNSMALGSFKFIPSSMLIRDLSHKDLLSLKLSQAFIPTGFRYSLFPVSPHELTASDMDEINKGKVVLYVYGIVSYDSAIGHHATRFCEFYDPKEKLFFQCDFHNDIE
jgi:hypothetical protein